MPEESGITLSSIERKINQANLRIHNIKRKNESTKNQITKNRDEATRLLLQKQALALSLIQQQKNNQRLREQNEGRINFLRKKNSERRQRQKREIRDILTAVYLVKAEDADQLRRISREHREKMRQMSESSVESNRKLNERARSQQGKGKQAYWRNKLYKLHEQNQEQKRLKSQILEQKSNELEVLLQKSNSLQQNLHTIAKEAHKERKKYLSALYMPVRKVASLIEQQYPEILDNPEIYQPRGAGSQNSAFEDSRHSSEPHMEFSSSAKASEAKLKIVLETLKKKQRTN